MKHCTHFAFLASLFLIAIVPNHAFAQARRSSRKVAEVRVIAFDTRGHALDVPVVDLFDSQDDKHMASRFHLGVAEGIPYGVYRIEARLTAYASDVRYVRVYQPSVTVVLGLTLSEELPDVPPILLGRIAGQARAPSKSFVKLVGLYNSISIEAPIADDGSFALGGLSDGRFLLMVVGESGILASRSLSVPYTGPPLEIDLSANK